MFYSQNIATIYPYIKKKRYEEVVFDICFQGLLTNTVDTEASLRSATLDNVKQLVSYGTCSVDCAKGTKRRKRVCERGILCPVNTKYIIDRVPCSKPVCPGILVTSLLFYTNLYVIFAESITCLVLKTWTALIYLH